MNCPSHSMNNCIASQSTALPCIMKTFAVYNQECFSSFANLMELAMMSRLVHFYVTIPNISIFIYCVRFIFLNLLSSTPGKTNGFNFYEDRNDAHQQSPWLTWKVMKSNKPLTNRYILVRIS